MRHLWADEGRARAASAQQLIVLLAGVHALRPSQICALTLDDIGPSADTLLTSGRALPLDQLTTAHLPTPPAVTRWPSPTCSASATPPPFATAPKPAH